MNLAFVTCACSAEPWVIEFIQGATSLPIILMGLFILKRANEKYNATAKDFWKANFPAFIYFFFGCAAIAGGIAALYKQMGF